MRNDKRKSIMTTTTIFWKQVFDTRKTMKEIIKSSRRFEAILTPFIKQNDKNNINNGDGSGAMTKMLMTTKAKQ